jgi:hypothetical protein
MRDRTAETAARREWTPKALARRASELFADLEPQGRAWKFWVTDPKMLAAFATVIAACDAEKADPELYVQAQVEVMGRVAVAKGFRTLKPGCFHGENADGRFQRWLERKNGKRASLVRHRDEEQERERRLAAAQVFGEAYIAGGASMEEATAAAREVLHGWVPENLTPHERWTALAAGCDCISHGLSDCVCAPDSWTWPAARMFVARVTAHDASSQEPVAGEGLDELGSLL